MNKNTIYTIQCKAYDYPNILKNIIDPPKQLYVISNNWLELVQRPALAIVGSRKASAYGMSTTTTLASSAAAKGIVIISGLAFGIDAVAHKAALGAGGLTIAVLAGGLDTIYPAQHAPLAQRIIEQGGALVSEHPTGTPMLKPYFIGRNRIVSGLSQAVLITEAGLKSGTLHTARFALEQGRDVLAVPGNITSETSVGTNNLIKHGAIPITDSQDILNYFNIKSPSETKKVSDPDQQLIVDLLYVGVHNGADLLRKSKLDVRAFNRALTMLEITGTITALGNDQWSL